MILLVRHPPVDAGGRCYGRLDLAANPNDVTRLAIDLRARMAAMGEPVPVWTSPARRCRAVAEKLGNYAVDDRLRELDFGAWEGVAWDDVPRASLDAWAADPWSFRPAGGESVAEMVERVRSFSASCTRDPCILLTHGGPLRVLVALLAGQAVDMQANAPIPGSVTEMRLA